MSGIGSIPVDLKKYIDATFYKYLPKVKTLRTAMAEKNLDSSQVTLEYSKMTQSYTEAKGYYGMADPIVLADGATPELDSFGTSDATSTPTSYGKAFRLERKLLNSGLPFQQAYVAQHSVEMLNTIENYVNTTLNTNWSSNAAATASASGGTWVTTGDPVTDITSAKNSFKKTAGGIDADFCAIHPDNYTSLLQDYRFQNSLYTTAGKVLDQGTITPHPFGLEWLVDTAVTKGQLYMGKKGMFGDLLITENYKTYEVDKGVIGKEFQAVFTFVDQYKLPYYLLKLTGI
ncbi:Uncharacterised protein [Candidatus Anstonella stagnisolia]|nr:Uncharacterised protein [Candidatus Anstonella stagnisolia]